MAPAAHAPDARREETGIESQVAVRLAGVTRRFNGTEAVSGLDLQIPAGSITGVIGPSGSGKTTTIRMMTGSLAPTDGEVQVLGEPPGQFRRTTRERIGYMPQLFSLYPDLTVGENVDFAAALYGLVFWRRWRRTRAVLQLLDLWSVRGRRAGRLSGGMKRRLELAAALVHQPDLLILDEPTAGIDPLLRRTVWDELHRLREGGVTAVVTTQYVTEAEECDLVALIAGGRLIAFGTPAEVRKSALGGEVVEVTMENLFDASTLHQAPGVLSIRQTGPKSFQLVVDDAGTATPETIQAMSEAGADVESIREYRPTFEDVFTALVERDRDAPAAAAGQLAAPDDGGASVEADHVEDDPTDHDPDETRSRDAA
jgi:ABC-2 type transport system ATP-binding protein